MRRHPVLSETDAFRLTVATAGMLVFAVILGWLATPAIGAIAFAVVAAISLGVYLRRPEPAARMPLREAADDDSRHVGRPDKRHVLVIANEALSGDRLRVEIRRLGADEVELDVMAPVLSSRTHIAYTDIDSETRKARSRLGRSLSWAHAQGFAVRGIIGDPDPKTAIEDQLRLFGADEVIVVTGERHGERWQEASELERLRQELDIPVVRVPVKPSDRM